MTDASLIEKAANEFHRLTKLKARGSKYPKDRKQKLKETIAGDVAAKKGINKDFFIKLMASPNF